MYIYIYIYIYLYIYIYIYIWMYVSQPTTLKTYGNENPIMTSYKTLQLLKLHKSLFHVLLSVLKERNSFAIRWSIIYVCCFFV